MLASTYHVFPLRYLKIILRKWENNEKYCSLVQEDWELLSARTNRWKTQFVDGKSKIVSFKQTTKEKSYLLISKKLRYPDTRKICKLLKNNGFLALNSMFRHNDEFNQDVEMPPQINILQIKASWEYSIIPGTIFQERGRRIWSLGIPQYTHKFWRAKLDWNETENKVTREKSIN